MPNQTPGIACIYADERETVDIMMEWPILVIVGQLPLVVALQYYQASSVSPQLAERMSNFCKYSVVQGCTSAYY